VNEHGIDIGIVDSFIADLIAKDIPGILRAAGKTEERTNRAQPQELTTAWNYHRLHPARTSSYHCLGCV
jgi:hypothetical protein